MPISPPKPLKAIAPVQESDESRKQLIPLENSLVPYQSDPIDDTPNFDLMKLISEVSDEVADEDLVMATTQCEEAIQPNTPKIVNCNSNTVMKKTTPNTTFSNCSFGNIDTLNIHITKTESICNK